MYYIGLDAHKRKISYCVKDGSGRIHAERSISATRLKLDHWMRSLPQPWSAAMEATMFMGGFTALSMGKADLCGSTNPERLGLRVLQGV